MAQQQTGGQTQIPQIGQSRVFPLGTAPQRVPHQVGGTNGMWDKMSQSANNFIGSGATLGEGNLFGTAARPGGTQALRQNVPGGGGMIPGQTPSGMRRNPGYIQGGSALLPPEPGLKQMALPMPGFGKGMGFGNNPPQTPGLAQTLGPESLQGQGQQSPAPIVPTPVVAPTEDIGLLDATPSVATPTTETTAPATTAPVTTTTATTDTTAPKDINTMAAEGIYAAGATTADELGFQEGQIATTDLDPYMNKYTQQVIEANEADILRGADKGMDMLGAQAQAANSFGGSRHGIAMGEMGRDVVGELAKSSAMLRKEGWDSATGLAKDDIMGRFEGSTQRMNAANQLGNISNLGFGMGQDVSDRLERQGTTQQALEQALIEAGKGQFDAYNNLPAETLAMLNAALGVTPYGQTQTDTKNPGLFDYLTLGASMK
jgi:hypothetical protein